VSATGELSARAAGASASDPSVRIATQSRSALSP
jgi:hypothetical protein